MIRDQWLLDNQRQCLDVTAHDKNVDRMTCNVDCFASGSSSKVYHCSASIVLSNDLQLNLVKSGTGLFGTSQTLKKLNLKTLVMATGCNFAVSELLKILVITIDNMLDFEDHIKDVVRTCNYHLRALHHIQ